jgi:amidohydrolase
MKLIDSLVTQAAGIAAVRRDIHAHPELCFQEVRTADVVAKSSPNGAFPFTAGLGTTGVVGIVKNGTSNRAAVGLRADMDALPMHRVQHLRPRQQAPGKMHACGHDGHTAMLLAAAQHLAKNRNFDGTVYLIFQPAEEGGGGAREMIKDGLFEQFPMDAVFGMHNWPGMKAGQFAVSPGAGDGVGQQVQVTMIGKGGHAALPHPASTRCRSPARSCRPSRPSSRRNMKPTDSAVISVTMIHAGEATNVIPDNCELQGTVRTFSSRCWT